MHPNNGKKTIYMKRFLLIPSLFLCFTIIYCDTISDVEDMEKEVNNLTLFEITNPGGSSSSGNPFTGCFVSVDLQIGVPITNNYLGDIFDRDYYVLELESSGTLSVYTSGSIDTWGQLYNSQCDSLTQTPFGGDGNNFRIDWSCSAVIYYVEVHLGPATGAGVYTMYADFTPE